MMADNIILKLTTNEYLDSFLDKELWQQAGKAKLVEMLNRTCQEAETYKKKRKYNKQQIYAAHNAICISGDRGAGKTVFLRNAEAIWQHDATNKAPKDDIYFLEIIDPTLLFGHDQFANVIVAQLYNAVEKKLQSSSIEQSRRNDFYTSLQNLANALGKTKEFKDYFGIDKILKYSSGVQIEGLFHDFAENCIDILGCKAIAIPIDDVDMALNKAFEVLDEVRRLLSCPYIITIISGSHHLYSHMTQVHFETLAAPQKLVSDNTLKTGFDTAKSLTEAYLTKVFPNHQRLPLLPIDDLLPSLKILENEADRQEITFVEYEKQLQEYFYYLCNGEARSAQWPRPQNAREVSQLIRSLPPSSYKNKFADYLWSIFQSWAEQKQDGVAYSNAITFQQIINNTQAQTLSIEQLLAFSPKQQIDTKFSGTKKMFLEEQLNSVSELSKTKDKTKYQQDNEKILRSVFNQDNLVLRSMPPLEFYTNRFFLTQKNINADPNNYLKFIYTHYDYYGTLSNRAYSIYFSRAFEILVLSILSLSGLSNINWQLQLQKILRRSPFYSIHAMNPTKFLDENDLLLDNEEEEGDERLNENESMSEQQFIVNFAKKIGTWCDKFKGKLNPPNNQSLIPLLHAVFNKVFTQLHLMRKDDFKLQEDEHLSDTVKRFEYLVINAFASFIRTGVIIHANPALTAKVISIRNKNLFKRSDRVVTRNIEGLVNFENKASLNELTFESILLSAVWQHPIFEENNVEQSKFKIGLGKDNIFSQKGNEWDEFYRIKKIVIDGYENFSYKSIKSWASTLSSQDLNTIIEQLRADIPYTVYKTEKQVKSINLKAEFPRLYNTLFNYQQENKK